MDVETTIEQVRSEVIRFRDERNWARFHDPKNLSIGLSIEAGELQELFLWKSDDEVRALLESKSGKTRLGEELADILIFVLYLSQACSLDLTSAIRDKLKTNAVKYPIDKSFNSSKKYTELGGE